MFSFSNSLYPAFMRLSIEVLLTFERARGRKFSSDEQLKAGLHLNRSEI